MYILMQVIFYTLLYPGVQEKVCFHALCNYIFATWQFFLSPW